MKRPSTTALLPIIDLQSGKRSIDLRFPAGECPELQEVEALGEAHVHGTADASPTRVWFELTLDVSVKAVCSRCLEEFELPVEAPFKLLMEREECSDVEWDFDREEEFAVKVPVTWRELDLGEVLRQCVELEKPLYPVKPGASLPDGVEPDDVPLPETPGDEPEPPTDPRWDALKKLRHP